MENSFPESTIDLVSLINLIYNKSFQEVAINVSPEWNLNPCLLNFVQMSQNKSLSGHKFELHSEHLIIFLQPLQFHSLLILILWRVYTVAFLGKFGYIYLNVLSWYGSAKVPYDEWEGLSFEHSLSYLGIYIYI